MKSKQSWDRGVDYEKMYKTFLADIRSLREKSSVRRLRRLAYTTILLIQLRNGARVSEAVEAAMLFAKTSQRELTVRVRKRSSAVRTIVIPREISQKEKVALKIVFADNTLYNIINNVKMYALRRYGINTHSLRYAFITYLLRRGVSASIIAKITQHATLRHILTYTQQKIAQEILRNM